MLGSCSEKNRKRCSLFTLERTVEDPRGAVNKFIGARDKRKVPVELAQTGTHPL
jgi:hypothetical protein